jgi:DNA polymerase
MARFMPGAKISSVHGQMRKVDGRSVIAMFHPAAALHQGSLKPSILADFARLPKLLEEARKGLGRNAAEAKTPAEPRGEDPKQLSLF